MFFSIISCDDKLTQADCERITDEDACVEKGCAYQSGFEMTIGCGETCHFTTESTAFSGCFLSDKKVREEVWVTYHRSVAEQNQIIILRHHIGNLTGWKNGSPTCVTCSADLWVENP
ncbi:hypothetical protein KKC22_13525 [Myxococcota bacterium]|nr:hypothetical protein [Myxococcota bacterium]